LLLLLLPLLLRSTSVGPAAEHICRACCSLTCKQSLLHLLPLLLCSIRLLDLLCLSSCSLTAAAAAAPLHVCCACQAIASLLCLPSCISLANSASTSSLLSAAMAGLMLPTS
jgi:hypothetical protein